MGQLLAPSLDLGPSVSLSSSLPSRWPELAGGVGGQVATRDSAVSFLGLHTWGVDIEL